MVESEFDKSPQNFRIFTKIRLKIAKFFSKLNQSYKKSIGAKSFFGLVGDILGLGILSLFFIFSLITGWNNFTFSLIIIKVVGLGSGLWLLKEKVIPMVIQILSSIRLISNK